jgi:hypothetical protein
LVVAYESAQLRELALVLGGVNEFRPDRRTFEHDRAELLAGVVVSPADDRATDAVGRAKHGDRVYVDLGWRVHWERVERCHWFSLPEADD